MPNGEPRATLSDRQARGGVIGGKGYGFQAAYIVSRIPLWLADPDFVQFLQEGAGDVDVLFSRASDAGRREERWYVQVKNHEVRLAEARRVLSQFRDTDAGSPGTYTRFTLACPGLHPDLRRVRAAVEELRGVAGFYVPGEDRILDNTWADLEGLVEALDLPVDAAFLVDKVAFDTDLAGLTDDASLRDLFVGRLLALEDWAGTPPANAAYAYEKLALLSHRALRETCSRQQVEALIRQAAGRRLPPLFPTAPGLGWAVSGLAFVLLVVGLLMAYRGVSVRVLQVTPVPTPWAPPPTPGPGETLVLVARFEQLGGVEDRDPSGRIVEALQGAVPSQMVDLVRFFEVPEPFGRGEEQAVRDLGARLGATIVIWGAYDPAGATAHFTVVPETPPDFEAVDFGPGPALSQIRDFDFYFSHQLPSEAAFFVDFAIGQLLYWSADYEAALHMFDQAVLNARLVRDVDPGALAYSYFYRGYVYQTQVQDGDQAALDYTRAISSNANLGSAYNNLGVLYADQKEYGEAISMFDQALKVDAANGVAWTNLGLAHVYCGDLDAAEAAYGRAIEISPDSANPHVHLALWYAAQERYDEALAEVDQALAIDADYVPAYVNRAGLELRLGQPERAEADLQQACRMAVQVERDPPCSPEGPALAPYPMLYYNLGQLRRVYPRGRDDFTVALAYYEKAVEVDPQDPRPYYGMALAEIELGDSEGAIAHLVRFLELSADPAFRAQAQAQLTALGYTGPWPEPARVPDCATP